MKNNKSEYNKLFNLSHKSDYYLTNNYEDNFKNDEWSSDIINFDDNIPINDDYDKEFISKQRYSFTENKGLHKRISIPLRRDERNEKSDSLSDE